MAKFLLNITLFVFFALAMTSCDPERSDVAPKLNVTIKTVYNNQPFTVGEIYDDGLGHRIRIDLLMSYFCPLIISDANGNDVVLKDFHLQNLDNDYTFTTEIPEGSYQNFSMGIGIPKGYNKDVDPSTYPNSHPLSVQGAQGMFWTWNTGYIFSKFEGKVDLTGTEGNPLDHSFAFHTGDDLLYSLISLDKNFIAEKNKTYDLVITIHADKLVKGDNDQIDLAVDYLTHTSGNFPLAERFVNNFSSAITVE
jgi:disulfide oxidoreductase YuzD